MNPHRTLLVVADDFGIGPETSRGILDLADLGTVGGSVLLVNSPFAAQAVDAWRASSRKLEIGWHPCLTLDRPLLAARNIPSLVEADGAFPRLGTFMRRLFSGRVAAGEIEAELRAQLERFQQLLGHAPLFVNFHHHLHVFPVVAGVLRKILCELRPRPYVRRVVESLPSLACAPGGRGKRAFLTLFGAAAARSQAAAHLPGNDLLAGISTPTSVCDPNYLLRWIPRVHGPTIELTCHPGHRDETLIGRDCTSRDGRVQARVEEFNRLADPQFKKLVSELGFELKRPSEFLAAATLELPHAA